MENYGENNIPRCIARTDVIEAHARSEKSRCQYWFRDRTSYSKLLSSENGYIETAFRPEAPISPGDASCLAREFPSWPE